MTPRSSDVGSGAPADTVKLSSASTAARFSAMMAAPCASSCSACVHSASPRRSQLAMSSAPSPSSSVGFALGSERSGGTIVGPCRLVISFTQLDIVV